MPNHTNIQALKSDKRFESLVKQQMNEHQNIIASHHKEMNTLRDSVKQTLERFNSLFEHCEMKIKDMYLFYDKEIIALKEKVLAHEIIISDQRENIFSINHQLQNLYLSFPSKLELEKFKNETDSKIKEIILNHIISFQECQKELKSLINNIKEDVVKSRCVMEQKFSEFNTKIENNSTISRLDKDGVLKAIRIWEKTIFIIEKKIENIYTLIDRINKRSEICHKQE
jgi:hypothetical protein